MTENRYLNWLSCPGMPEELKNELRSMDQKTIRDCFCRNLEFGTGGLRGVLDRPVSGVVLLAKTSKALSRMVEKVRTRDFEKHYWAVVKNAPPQSAGILEDWLVKNEERNKSYVFSSARPNAKLARLEYREVAVSDGGYHLLDINLHTGRHHQIRCQLANIGCPIKGDLKYGAPRTNPDGSITLHARSITFEHPVTHNIITIEAPNSEIEKMFNI